MTVARRLCYLDHAATTPLDPRVAAAMQPFTAEGWCGNPSSFHWAGRWSGGAVEEARQHVAALLHARSQEIVFTGSGTESINLALLGVMAGAPGGHLVTTAIEHTAVLATARHLERGGCAVTSLPVGADGLCDPQALRQALRPDTRLVSIMAANHMVGTMQPWAELARIAHEHGALFHTDAVQAAGKVPLDVGAASIDLLSLSAHKLRGPQGVGALYVRRGLRLTPLIHGCGQEGGLRSGSENVAGIVGFGRAAAIAEAEMDSEAARLTALRDRIIDGVIARVPATYLVGDRAHLLPGHLCLRFAGLRDDALGLVLSLDIAGIAVSSGAACGAPRGLEPGRVLAAMGLDPRTGGAAVRLSLGRGNDERDVERLLDVLPQVVAAMRPRSPAARLAAPAA
ncbi:MAG TPA: cysteine desulfurase family protein [Polyangia bacterium]